MSLGSFENIGASRRECNSKILRFDQACLQIGAEHPVEFWSQTSECEGCILQKNASLEGFDSVIVDTRNPLIYSIRNKTAEICNGKYLLSYDTLFTKYLLFRYLCLTRYAYF